MYTLLKLYFGNNFAKYYKKNWTHVLQKSRTDNLSECAAPIFISEAVDKWRKRLRFWASAEVWHSAHS